MPEGVTCVSDHVQALHVHEVCAHQSIIHIFRSFCSIEFSTYFSPVIIVTVLDTLFVVVPDKVVYTASAIHCQPFSFCAGVL